MTHEENIQKLAALIKDIHIAMFATVEADGSIRSRPMATQQTDFDGSLWFFTGEHSPKAGEVRQDQHVNVIYAAPDKNRYVSVSGKAAVVHDQAKAKEMWNPLYKAWFPQGLEDPNLALLRVDVEKAEYWDSPSGAVVQMIGFVKAVATGERYQPSPGEHEKVELTR